MKTKKISLNDIFAIVYEFHHDYKWWIQIGFSVYDYTIIWQILPDKFNIVDDLNEVELYIEAHKDFLIDDLSSLEIEDTLKDHMASLKKSIKFQQKKLKEIEFAYRMYIKNKIGRLKE